MAQGLLKKAKANTSTKRYGFHQPFNLLSTAVAFIRSTSDITLVEGRLLFFLTTMGLTDLFFLK